ncbi:vacuolar protein [Cyclospora cayetanensis]|uniref:Vacuolar protein n=1 Tax=Cyclospora cayetanensis TaxID=88456 RepID=A0A1D3D8W4_9EIME|nr:vacuolar protein [Cyclospora cayetanensis]
MGIARSGTQKLPSLLDKPISSPATEHQETTSPSHRDPLLANIAAEFALFLLRLVVLAAGQANMLSTFFGSACSVEIALDKDGRKCTWLSREKKGEKLPIYSDVEDVSGVAVLNLKTGKKLEHNGIKVELVGQVDTLYDRSSTYDFFSISKDLEPPGLLLESKNSIVKEHDFVVQNVGPPPEIKNSIKMEVGIEDCLHIEFEFDKSRYHLKDVVIGKVYFVLVRIKIKDMQLDIIKTETAGCAECIPVRLYLSGLDLTPTYKNVQNKFSVRYFLNLVLVDEEDRRYFKKQEIILWRKKIG